MHKIITLCFYRRGEYLYHRYEVWRTIATHSLHPRFVHLSAQSVDGIPAPTGSVWIVTTSNGEPVGEGWVRDDSVTLSEYNRYVERQRVLGRL